MARKWWQDNAKVEVIAHDVQRELERAAIQGRGKRTALELAAASDHCDRRWSRETVRRYIRGAVDYLRTEIGDRVCSDLGGYWLAGPGAEWEANETDRRSHPVGTLANIAQGRRRCSETQSRQLTLL